nr:PREDICTED: putative G-protein coupled receptor F59B2.13 [Linepithema humile]
MFSENNLGKDYSSISKHELELHVCNNERDIDESLRNMVKEFIHPYNIYMTFNPVVNISRIEKFQDLCNKDIVGRHFSITYFINQLYSFYYMFHAIADDVETYINFRKYSLPIFIILGLLGNCLSASVLFRKKMRSFSSNIYLGVLAICDIAYSIILFIEWLVLMNIHLDKNYLFWLYFLVDILTFFFEFMSVWLVVVFTIERYIVTKYPLLRRAWCTVKRAKIIVITLIGLAILYTILHVFLFIGLKYYLDEVSYFEKKGINVYDLYKYIKFEKQTGVRKIRTVIDSITLFTLPALVIVICNTLIGYHIYQQNRVRKMLITASDSSNERTQIFSDKKLQYKITRMLILVSSIFVILKLPEHYFHYISSYIPKYVNLLVMYIIFKLLDTAHYSINFVLYCATGQTFRRELIHMFTKRKNVSKNKNEENV